MDDAVNVGVGLKDTVEASLVGDIELSELGLLAADQLNALESLSRGVVEVVSDDDLVASLEESEGGERANVARSTVWGENCGVSGWDGGTKALMGSLPGDEN